jgi:adenylate cyclase
MLTSTVKETPSSRTTSSIVIAPNAKSQTFLFADLAGYTGLTDAHGDEAAAEVADVRRILPEYAAEEIKRIGDALMIRIPDAGDAVAPAVRVINEISTGHGSLAVRIAMHTGPAVNRDGDWFGAAVNLAARVAEAAQPGEILMTGASHKAAGPTVSAFNSESRDRQSFKNVAAPVAIFTLAAPAARSRPVCRRTPSAGWRSTRSAHPLSTTSPGAPFTSAQPIAPISLSSVPSATKRRRHDLLTGRNTGLG